MIMQKPQKLVQFHSQVRTPNYITYFHDLEKVGRPLQSVANLHETLRCLDSFKAKDIFLFLLCAIII